MATRPLQSILLAGAIPLLAAAPAATKEQIAMSQISATNDSGVTKSGVTLAATKKKGSNTGKGNNNKNTNTNTNIGNRARS
jgi:hypothetical protein